MRIFCTGGLLIHVLISICIRELSHIVCIEDLCENHSLLWSLDISELAVSSLDFYMIVII